MKKLIFILMVGSLFIGCSVWNEDSESTINPLVGTWNLTNIQYFETIDCSGVPIEILDVNSLEQLAIYGMDEYQLKLTVTLDLNIIAIHTQSFDTSNVREEDVSTGILLDHGYQYCVIFGTGLYDCKNSIADCTCGGELGNFHEN